jgi:hypothetical protein
MDPIRLTALRTIALVQRPFPRTAAVLMAALGAVSLHACTRAANRLAHEELPADKLHALASGIVEQQFVRSHHVWRLNHAGSAPSTGDGHGGTIVRGVIAASSWCMNTIRSAGAPSLLGEVQFSVLSGVP